MDENKIKIELTEIYRIAKSKKMSTEEIEAGLKRYLEDKIDKYERGMLNNLCGLDNANTNMGILAFKLVLYLDRQYERNKSIKIATAYSDIEMKKENVNTERLGCISILLPFVIGGFIGYFIFGEILGVIMGGLMLYFPIAIGIELGHPIIIGIIGTLIECAIMEKIPNQFAQVILVMLPGAAALIWQLVKYIKSKYEFLKCNAENTKYIRYVHNDYIDDCDKNIISKSRITKHHDAQQLKKHNTYLLLVFLFIFISVASILFYIYMNTPSKNWHIENGNCYYIDKNGRKLANTMIEDKFKKYFLDSDGAMVKNNWVEYENNIYYFGANGIMEKNKIIDDTFYVNKEGKLEHSKYITDQNKDTYFLGEDGRILKNCKTPDGRMANERGIVH